MSSSDIPRTSDATPNWAADTDPVGPVTPELALVDPVLTPGGDDNEVTMSSMQVGDGMTFGGNEQAAAPAPADPAPAVPLQPLQPPLQTAPPVEPALLAAPVSGPAAPSAEGLAVADMRDVPLGTLVFRAGLLPEERLEEALQEGMKTGKRLGEILLERGWVSETDLGRLLAGQKGLPFVELDPAAIDPTAPPLLHPEKARLHGALPIGFENGVPVVAVTDPSNDLVVENVRRALACEPVLVVAGRDALQSAINHAYGAVAQTDPAPSAEPAEPQVEVAAPAPVAPELVAEPPTVAPAVEPVAVEPVAVEPVVAPPVEPAVPVVPVVPVVSAAPAPSVEEPVAAEPPAPPVLEPEPVAVQPIANGSGIWLGQEPDPLVVEAQAQTAPPEPAPAPELPVEAAQPQFLAEPEPQAVPQQPAAQIAWAVMVRLADGERIELGSYAHQDEAVQAGRAAVAEISAEGAWPLFAGRFVRPEAIVSVDLVELEVTRWLGSQARAAALGPEGQPGGAAR